MTASQFTTWRTSSYSGSNGGDCVEVAHANAAVGIRDSKERGPGQLTVGARTWAQLCATVQRPRR